MKRLLGLIGLVYLSILAVVFYFFSTGLLFIIAGISLLAVAFSVVLIIIKRGAEYRKSLLIASSAALCACIAFILYTNIYYLPIINEYSDKELNVSGYVCDSVRKSENGCSYIFETEKINGENKNVKISIVSYNDLYLNPFDKADIKLSVYASENNYMLSRGIFLSSYSEDCSIEKTGEKQFSLYSIAVSAREKLKNSLAELLPEDYYTLCNAIFIGDKQSLDYDVKEDFYSTGTSFLIVVSGMHLTIAAGFILFFVRKITKNRFVLFISASSIVLLFMAITGFSPSVVRSGVMFMITYGSQIVFRKADGINSLGAAAIVITLFNPYAVGDIGMILSFSATLGIILWAGKIRGCLLSKLKFKFRLFKYLIDLISVSLAASLWIMPITMIYFNRISPLTVFISLIAEPIVSVILVCSMFCSVLYVIPVISFLAYPFALVAGILCKLLLFIIRASATIPFCSVNSDETYFYIWISVTILLVIIGYIIKARSFYIRTSILISAITLILGWAFFALSAYSTTTLNVYSTGGGMAVSVENGYNFSVLSCTGSSKRREQIIDEISADCVGIDNVIIPVANKNSTDCLSALLYEFDVSNILVYDKNVRKQKIYSEYDGHSRTVFGENVHFTVNIADGVSDDIINVDRKTYQILKSGDSTVMLMPEGGDVLSLPEKYRTADYLVIDSLPKNYKLLKCKSVIYTGKAELYEEVYNSLLKINADVLCPASDKLSIEL